MKFWLAIMMALLISGCVNTSRDTVGYSEFAQSRDLFDDDDDGVINERDKCADTLVTAIVDNDGCPTNARLNRENGLHILFANDSDQVPPDFMREITTMADFLATHPEAQIELKGYASPVGTDEYNLGLSKRRAANVRQLLINKGVAPQKITTVGFGETKPVAADTEEKMNKLSRRVRARVVGESGHVLEEWTIFTLRDN